MTELRFTPGQKYVFTNIRLSRNSEHGHITVYMPEINFPLSIQYVLLECVEHHRVPTAHDPSGEQRADGFIFEDVFGQRWTNQYPKAHYGQTSDAMDRIVHPPKGLVTPTNILDRWTLIDEIIEELSVVLRPEDDPRRMAHIIVPDDNARTALQLHMDALLWNAQMLMGKRAVLKPWVITRKDGTEYETNSDILEWQD